LRFSVGETSALIFLHQIGSMLNQNPNLAEFSSTLILDRPLGTTILVVEDEAFVRDAACDVLEHEGYRVLRARSASEAHEVVRTFKGTIQLLLSDIVLPGTNGLALAKALRADCPGLKAILVSGYPREEMLRFGLSDCPESYFPKPFSSEALIRKVKLILESDD